MEVEFTGRQVKVAKSTQEMARQGIERVEQLLGKVTSAACIFRAERHLQIVEITLKTRQHGIVAHGESTTQLSALRLALDHAESQAQRFRERMRTRKRQPKDEKTPEIAIGKSATRSATKSAESFGEPAEMVPRTVGGKRRAVIRKDAIEVQSRPGGAAVVEPHVLRASEAIAARPMTIEQAVKKAESEDRELLIFRDSAGRQFVLHRRRDEQMEMVEII